MIPVTHRFTAFGGARCEIHALTSEQELSRSVGEVYAFETAFSRFLPDSELSQFNRSQGHRVQVSAHLENILRTALAAWDLTDGLVHAGTLRAVIAAGYDESIERVRRRDATSLAVAGISGPPNAERPRPLPDMLTVGHGWAELAAGGAIDLGGIGKGWLADRLAEDLGNAVVNLGGDLRATGRGPSGEGWSVGLCDGSVVSVSNAGVATSGVAGRRWFGGHHLIDPRTGLPAVTEVADLTVVAANAVTAEALAKAALLLGGPATQGTLAWVTERGAMRVVAGSPMSSPPSARAGVVR